MQEAGWPSIFDGVEWYGLAGGLIALLVSIALVCAARITPWLAHDSTVGPQKIHGSRTSRSGGIGIFTGIGLSAFLVAINHHEFTLMFVLGAITPIFFFGLLEDFTNRVSANVRLYMSLASALVLVMFCDIKISPTGFWLFDMLLALPLMAIIMSMVAIATQCHAINLIDGLNGLASGLCAVGFVSVGYLAALYGDQTLLVMSLALLFPTLGFFVVNFPKGVIFLGDGGAYLLGMFFAIFVIMMPERNPEVSSFASLLLVAFPIYETLRSFVRRSLMHSQGYMIPDDQHLHSLIYQLVSKVCRWLPYARNATASLLTLILPSTACALAVVYHNRVEVLIVALFALICCYEVAMYCIKRQLQN